MVVLVIVLLLVLFLFAYPAYMDAKEKEKEELKKQERRFSITGYSSFTFKLKGSNYCSDIAKGFLKDIKEGDCVVLMPEFFNEFDRYAISVRLFGRHIGYVDRTEAYHWAEKLFGGSAPNYELCIAKTVTLNEGYEYPLVTFEVFYKDVNGKAKFNHKNKGADYIYIDPIEGCGKDLAEDLTKRFFTLSQVSREIIYTHPELYGLDEVQEDDDDLNEKWHDEDVQFLKEFIFGLYSGAFQDVKAKTKFLQNAAKDRVYGNNDKLKVLLSRYLDFKEIMLS